MLHPGSVAGELGKCSRKLNSATGVPRQRSKWPVTNREIEVADEPFQLAAAETMPAAVVLELPEVDGAGEHRRVDATGHGRHPEHQVAGGTLAMRWRNPRQSELSSRQYGASEFCSLASRSSAVRKGLRFHRRDAMDCFGDLLAAFMVGLLPPSQATSPRHPGNDHRAVRRSLILPPGSRPSRRRAGRTPGVGAPAGRPPAAIRFRGGRTQSAPRARPV